LQNVQDIRALGIFTENVIKIQNVISAEPLICLCARVTIKEFCLGVTLLEGDALSQNLLSILFDEEIIDIQHRRRERWPGDLHSKPASENSSAIKKKEESVNCPLN
jgi:hypothetical protein